MDYLEYKNAFLAHHGIKGQKWGVRNGPPYPLKAGAHSSAEKRYLKGGHRPSANNEAGSSNRSYGVLTKEGIVSQRKKLSQRINAGDKNAFAKYANTLSYSNTQANTYAQAYSKKSESYRKDAEKKRVSGDEKRANKLVSKSDAAMKLAEKYKLYERVGKRELKRLLKKADDAGQKLSSKKVKAFTRKGEHAFRDFVVMTAAVAAAPGPGWAIAAAANFKIANRDSYYRRG